MIILKDNKRHSAAVEKIQKAMRESDQKVTLSSVKTYSNTLRDEGYKKKTTRLDLSSLNKILSIDEEELTVIVEPRITIYDLCKETLAYGYIPLVVPEFTSITVGGAINGAALESSSHLYGQFNDTCLEYEVILGDGSLAKASANENVDLFYAIPGSYGTLALLTLVKIKLQKATSYVTLNYKRFSTFPELLTFFQNHPQSDFLEGIALSENWFVAINAHIAQTRPPHSPLFRQRGYFAKWFYGHVVEVTEKGDYSDTMPLKDYLFRFDRGGFWIGRALLSWRLLIQALILRHIKEVAEKIRMQSRKVTPHTLPRLPLRAFFGWAFTSKSLYRLWHHVPRKILENLFLIHDFYAPWSRAETVFKHFQSATRIYPVWLCPLKGTKTPQFLSPHIGHDRFLNIGLYGISQTHKSTPALSAELEKEIVENGGRKMLYSYTYYSEEEFSKIYDMKRYEELRNKYHAEKFPSLYNKISVWISPKSHVRP